MRVYLDPGHGGPDRGGVPLPGLDEANLNLIIALRAGAALEQAGADVRLCREDDNITQGSKAELIRRVQEATDWPADCYVSIHNNSMGGGGHASGTETFVQLRNQFSHSLGRHLQREMTGVMGRPDRGVLVRDYETERIYKAGSGQTFAKDYYHVLRECQMPAAIVECGFMDNASDAELLRRPDVLKALGDAISKAVVIWAREWNLLSPPSQPTDWRVDAIAEARRRGLLTQDHPPGSSAEIEELAAVANRLDERVQELAREVAEVRAALKGA